MGAKLEFNIKRERRINVELNLPQWRAFNIVREHTRTFLGWGRGVGKTWYTVFTWCQFVAKYDGITRKKGLKKQRGVRIIAMLPTLKQFKDLYWETLEDALLPGGDWAFLGATLSKERGQVKFPGGSWIKPFPAAAASGRRARGMRADILTIDEIDDIEADVYYAVAIPMLSDHASLGIELLAGTPTKGRQGLWAKLLEMGKLADKLRRHVITRETALAHESAKSIYALFEGMDPEDWPEQLSKDPTEATVQVLLTYHALHATYRDAPETITPMSVAMAKASMPAATFEREYEANPNAGEGLVYSLDEDLHVRDAPAFRSFEEFHVGVDFGRHGAMALCGVLGSHERRVLWILEEYYEEDCPIDIWDERASQWRNATFWPDTSRTDRCDNLRNMGLTVGDTDRGPGSVLDGIERVGNLLYPKLVEVGQVPLVKVVPFARLYIAPKCVNTIREFNTYRYPKLPDGTFGTVPMKKNDHLMDAIRYVALSVFGRPTRGRTEVPGR